MSTNVEGTFQPAPSITLSDIVAEVAAERIYAATKWPTPDGDSIACSHAFGEWLLYAKQYLDDAVLAATKEPGNLPARKKVIKAISLLAWAAQHPMSKAEDHYGSCFHVKDDAGRAASEGSPFGEV